MGDTHLSDRSLLRWPRGCRRARWHVLDLCRGVSQRVPGGGGAGIHNVCQKALPTALPHCPACTVMISRGISWRKSWWLRCEGLRFAMLKSRRRDGGGTTRRWKVTQTPELPDANNRSTPKRKPHHHIPPLPTTSSTMSSTTPPTPADNAPLPSAPSEDTPAQSVSVPKANRKRPDLGRNAYRFVPHPILPSGGRCR